MNNEVVPTAKSGSNCKQPVLIIGGDGLIGASLKESLIGADYPVISSTRRDKGGGPNEFILKLEEVPSVWKIPDITPSVVVLCAGISSFYECETNPEKTFVVNVKHTIELCRYFSLRGAFILYLSSSAVFDGSKPQVPVNEPPSPTTEYGRQKALVEKFLISTGVSYRIIRLGKVVSHQFPLFNEWIDKLKAGEGFSPFDDLIIAPVSLSSVLTEIRDAIDRAETGIRHLSGSRDISYADAAFYIAQKLKLPVDKIIPRPISLDPNIIYAPKFATLKDEGDDSNATCNGFEGLSDLFR